MLKLFREYDEREHPSEFDQYTIWFIALYSNGATFKLGTFLGNVIITQRHDKVK